MSRENRAFAGAVLVSVVGLFVIGERRPRLLLEDGLVENLAAGGFLTAALLAVAAFIRLRASLTPADAVMLLGTIGVATLAFLSEISFGARLFDIRMPEMRGGGEFDGAHDIVIVIARRVSAAGRSGLIAAAVCGVVLLVAAMSLLVRFWERFRLVLSKPFAFRLALAAGMLASAVTLDLSSSSKAKVLEEMLELAASGVLVLALLARLREGPLPPAAPVAGIPGRTGQR